MRPSSSGNGSRDKDGKRPQGGTIWRRTVGLIAAIAGALLLLSPAEANKNFAPIGSSTALLSDRGARWVTRTGAENGEIIGTSRCADGGWLFLDKPFQDVQFASTFRCSDDCRAGAILRAQMTAEGLQGVYLALPEAENAAAAFALRLDAQGRGTRRESLPRANGPGRFVTTNAVGARIATVRPVRPGGAGTPLPLNSPYTRPTTHIG
jgi:hypothetical protein